MAPEAAEPRSWNPSPRRLGARVSPSLTGLVDEPPRSFGPGETVFAAQDPADRLYEVMSGVVRTVRLGREGQRIIYDFYVAGEVFGLESQPAHRCSAEAVGEASVARYDRARLECAALADRAVATQLWSWLTLSGEQASGRLVLLARGDAAQKIVHFLLEMARRTRAGDALELPMSRYDIADYLGLSSETVSRGFSALRRRGLIATEGRSVSLLKPGELRRLDAAYV